LRMWLLWFFCHTGWKRRWGGENLSRVTESVVFQSSKSDLWERGNYLFGVRSLGFALFLRRPGAAFKAASSRRTPKVVRDSRHPAHRARRTKRAADAFLMVNAFGFWYETFNQSIPRAIPRGKNGG
jgi:hypothetical protein